ncbi:MAG: CpsD/CapB family tyrosine-protein kinase [Bacilli bacterium]|nr:CpsD/CapB family tyrosine-protein kinase [Bacilli bacterium]
MKDLIVNKNPKSMFSEAIKTIRTNLAFSSLGDEMTVILNTSPEAGDGKSFISANLALAYADEGKKVLLIDCDLRKGRQHEIFNIDNSIMHGYSNLILNYNKNTKLEEYIVKTENKKVFVIPTGPMPPNPVELLNSENNKELLESLRKDYDIIILDCPPVIGLSDTLVLTKYSDANIVIVSNKKTKLENLQRTQKAFEQIGSKITGVIVNKATPKDSGYYGYYYNDSYYAEEKKKKTKKKIRRK